MKDFDQGHQQGVIALKITTTNNNRNSDKELQQQTTMMNKGNK